MAHKGTRSKGMGMTRTFVAVVAAALAALACAVPAGAATPFNAGVGSGWDLAVDSAGTGHAVWVTDETGDRVQYCRVPAGGTACDAESDYLSFPSGTNANVSDDAQVFTPAPNKVVIAASCYVCGPVVGATDYTYRWVSTNGGVSFAAPFLVGDDMQLNGQAGWIDSSSTLLGVEGTLFQAMPAGSADPINLGGSGLFVYSSQATPVAGTSKVLHATNNLDTVKYAVYDGSGSLNDPTNWASGKLLSGDEGDNSETHLSSAGSGSFLTYQWFVANDSRIGLRQFDPATDTFGAPTYIEGPNSIDDNGVDYPHHSQDAGGRLHAVWRSLHDGGRLRYTRSDNGGASWTPVANLAQSETFIDPTVEAGSAGTGFAIWGFGAGGATQVRMVPIDPQFEADPNTGPPAGPDTTDPSVGGFGASDTTLLPGQGTTFRFRSSEGGLAILTVRKQVPGLRIRKSGRRVCVPKTRKQVRKLRRSVGSAKALRKALKKRRCKARKPIGRLTKQVAAGQNSIVWNGRLAGRKLRPGRYFALLQIRDAAGNLSATETLRFRVLKPRIRRG